MESSPRARLCPPHRGPGSYRGSSPGASLHCAPAAPGARGPHRNRRIFPDTHGTILRLILACVDVPGSKFHVHTYTNSDSRRDFHTHPDTHAYPDANGHAYARTHPDADERAANVYAYLDTDDRTADAYPQLDADGRAHCDTDDDAFSDAYTDPDAHANLAFRLRLDAASVRGTASYRLPFRKYTHQTGYNSEVLVEL